MKVEPGNPLLFGATFMEGGRWNFAIFSEEPLSHLSIASYETQNEIASFKLCDRDHRIGDVWSVTVSGLPTRFLYAWRGSRGLIIDPFARLLYTGAIWGNNRWQQAREKNELFFGVAATPSPYRWSAPAPAVSDPIIYELHVRGMTKDLSSRVKNPGTWSGLKEKAEYIASLGVNTIELLPIFEFDETEWMRPNPITGEMLYNYWGYSPLHFFSPMQRYCAYDDPIQASEEVKACIDHCHRLGLQVILDVVYNHTGEGNEMGPAYSMKLLAEKAYYLLDEEERHTNYSGCGNTLNVGHPVVQMMIRESLRHWVLEYHVDGFRFDLAGSFLRCFHGREISISPLLQEISGDPLLKNKLFILEPWDSGFIYKTGTLFRQEISTPFYEWNDRFRDDVRCYMKGDQKKKGLFATRFAGSEDMYSNAKKMTHSVNYVTSHDGFSLYDLVSYNEKHNEINGEENRDGTPNNCSWNCGIEGPSNDKKTQKLRMQQMKNFLMALLLSRGVIMLQQGDEYAHTKNGNNNSWCQDTRLNWFQWDTLERHHELVAFLKKCIALRGKSTLLSNKNFLTSKNVDWHGVIPFNPDWDNGSNFLGMVTKLGDGSPEYYIGFLPSSKGLNIELPYYEDRSWHLKLWTSTKPVLTQTTSFQKLLVPPFSSFLLEWE